MACAARRLRQEVIIFTNVYIFSTFEWKLNKTRDFNVHHQNSTCLVEMEENKIDAIKKDEETQNKNKDEKDDKESILSKYGLGPIRHPRDISSETLARVEAIRKCMK